MNLLEKIKFRIKYGNSNNYWKRRYQKGGSSGSGSFGVLAYFKSDVINKFVEEKSIESVIEFGCGDGNQLTLSKYPQYIGFDISLEAINACGQLFKEDLQKQFFMMEDYKNQKAELVLSLDVIYHLIEEKIFTNYLELLFASSLKYVVIYSSNTSVQLPQQSGHVKHRIFTEWIEKNIKGWTLSQVIKNKYPFNGDISNSSIADFYIYRKNT